MPYSHIYSRIRLEHIECDLQAWADKDDDNCDEDVLDLKRKLHCSLIPAQCLDAGLHGNTITDVCNPQPKSEEVTSGSGNISYAIHTHVFIVWFIAVSL